MSIFDDLIAVTKELDEAKTRVSIAGGVLAAAMATAAVMRDSQADVWRVVAMKRLVTLSRSNSASILYVADQLAAELSEIKGAK